jgi:hypothetical protein
MIKEYQQEIDRMASQEQGTTTFLIPDRLTQEMLKAPKSFNRLFFPLMIGWTVLIPTIFLTGAFGATKNPIAVIALILPFYFITPVVRKLTTGRPAMELSRRINEVTGCGMRFERAIRKALEVAPWGYRVPRYEIAVNVEEDMLYVHRKLTLAEDLSSVTIGPVTRNSSKR